MQIPFITALFCILAFLVAPIALYSQDVETDSTNTTNTTYPNEIKNRLDSLYIEEIQQASPNQKAKVLHAEPLFIDLIRDLGARKGEKEWNLGMELSDKKDIRAHHGLIEYEWAPINRLGLEVELPFSYYTTQNPEQKDSLPSSKLESLKLAAQHSFFVSEKMKTSLALGYIHQLTLVDFDRFTTKEGMTGHIFNPFFVAAKRWGQNFHTLIYTGPRVVWPFGQSVQTVYDINTNIHYMLDGTRNFIGVELNKQFDNNDFRMVLRPQIRVALADNLMIGIVKGIPLGPSKEGISAFTRLIYEPGHRALSRKHCD
jgi:hypothetical protein